MATTPDGWADAKSGVKLENVTLENVYFRPDSAKPSALLDFSVMREGDYINNLYLNNVNMRGAGALMVIDDSCKRVNIKRGHTNTDNEESLSIKYAPHYDETPSEKTERGLWEIEGKIVYDCRREK